MDRTPSRTDDTQFNIFQTLIHDYARRLGDIWDGKTKKNILDAQKRYSDRMTTAPNDPVEAQKTWEAAHREYVDAVCAAWKESQTLYTQAYSQYLDGYREAWGKCCRDRAISPLEMMLVAQSSTTAVGYATATIGNWSLIEWAGVPPWALSLARNG
ncbi:hypothetical protein [Archangium lansingense]|uniref:Uncharacterized protein n=1 Tax=Archangium lansingense TaxID=2995310 RepID=A0ABT4ACM9_9BACT|nr:hypothetical protein [Archangium lansinium]MCY1079433.1 hypothetical protein [Archangium lansinium]